MKIFLDAIYVSSYGKIKFIFLPGGEMPRRKNLKFYHRQHTKDKASVTCCMDEDQYKMLNRIVQRTSDRDGLHVSYSEGLRIALAIASRHLDLLDECYEKYKAPEPAEHIVESPGLLYRLGRYLTNFRGSPTDCLE